ncbi:hypothetical protein A1O1_03029 [Capronia coronata CBS 617.96]|uniref:DASH complex subunit SPC34 n=1 Tax=Capronia coronata CBS 617.96 TaxID=1182541 RepID=W9YPZ7_9EURO|nr:uncharacterized protein A1O1_03029 [Capronia coronata CBS 617.96]EXJ94633.1 hypothetical protein A1O1_03029 [Capronia coronata CBS 617.96]
MALLASHLEQISTSAKSIAELEFPPQKIFTSALLKDHEITTLIRDTEPHERALFSLDPSALIRTRQQNGIRSTGAESGLHGREFLFPSAPPVKQSVITRLLGNEMLQEIRKSSSNTARSKDGVNVEALLQGAQRLCQIYNVAGADDKIQVLHNRYGQISASISALEERVYEQQSLLERRNKGQNHDEEWEANALEKQPDNKDKFVGLTDQDFQFEEDEIKELEARKRALEARVSGIEKDLGGLLR